MNYKISFKHALSLTVLVEDANGLWSIPGDKTNYTVICSIVITAMAIDKEIKEFVSNSFHSMIIDGIGNI
jgi:hypothetical protein